MDNEISKLKNKFLERDEQFFRDLKLDEIHKDTRMLLSALTHKGTKKFISKSRKIKEHIFDELFKFTYFLFGILMGIFAARGEYRILITTTGMVSIIIMIRIIMQQGNLKRFKKSYPYKKNLELNDISEKQMDRLV
jgi:hypothetical protein